MGTVEFNVEQPAHLQEVAPCGKSYGCQEIQVIQVGLQDIVLERIWSLSVDGNEKKPRFRNTSNLVKAYRNISSRTKYMAMNMLMQINSKPRARGLAWIKIEFSSIFQVKLVDDSQIFLHSKKHIMYDPIQISYK